MSAIPSDTKYIVFTTTPKDIAAGGCASQPRHCLICYERVANTDASDGTGTGYRTCRRHTLPQGNSNERIAARQ